MAPITAFTQGIAQIFTPLARGFAQGITPFLPAFKQLLAIMLPAVAVLLLGAGLIVLDNQLEPMSHRGFLALLGEGLMLSAGLVMAVGTVLCWWRMFMSAKLVGRDDRGQL